MGTVTMEMGVKKGIDVSDNQGVIDWGAVKAAGVEFAILRSVRRSGKTDFQFENNVRGCLEQGIPFDVYKYSYALSEVEARIEMRQVYGLLDAKGIHCRIWFDAEWKAQRELGKKAVTGIIRQAKEVVEDYGYPFGIYCNLDWYRFVINTAVFPGEDFWVARYPNNAIVQFGTVPDASKRPVTGQNLFGWQWSSKGRVDGIRGNVDLDEIYQETEIPVDENPYKEPVYTLYRGRLAMDEEYVKWLQWHLVRLGYLRHSFTPSSTAAGEKNAIDGIYGSRTEEAVYRFQRKYPSTYQGNNPDRKVGPLTRAMLKAL